MNKFNIKKNNFPTFFTRQISLLKKFKKKNETSFGTFDIIELGFIKKINLFIT